MAGKIRIRALMKGDVAEVKALIRHPMETGRRKDEQGNSIPAHFITEVEATVGDRTLMTARWGAAVSQNPFLGFRVRGVQPGDELIVRYVDNKGETGQGTAIIK
jgi:sulfur-oxidizing protein SoxZ